MEKENMPVTRITMDEREVHVNTMEGFWSLLRSWLRPHRGISQEKLPLYLGFFEEVHNVRKRGKALLGALLETLLA
jgi:transposase-like protein